MPTDHPTLYNPATIYLIRHGQTEWNLAGRMQGQQDSPLTLEGIQIAQTVAKSLKDIPFKAIYSSDLLRAQKTAEIIALEHELAISASELLRERSYGRFEGSTIEEFESELKSYLQVRETLPHQERFNYKLAPDIESDAEIVSRFITHLREASLAHSDETIALVSHGSIMRAFLIHVGFASYQELPYDSIENNGYVVMKSDGVEFDIVRTVGVHKRSKL